MFSGDLKFLEPSLVKFAIFTNEEIHKLSVKKIVTSLTFDPLGHPLPGGLYDLALGPHSEKSDPCTTCLKNSYQCPGHFGHIELPVLVVNPVFYSAVATILKLSCLSCHTLQIHPTFKQVLITQMDLLNSGYVVEAQELANLVNVLLEKGDDNEEKSDENISVGNSILNRFKILAKKSSTVANNKTIETIRSNFVRNFLIAMKPKKKCIDCKKIINKLSIVKNLVSINETETKRSGKTSTRMIMPDEIREKLRNIWNVDREILLQLFPILNTSTNENAVDIFFLDALLVTPPSIRPINIVNDQIAEHPKTTLYKTIIDHCLLLRHIINTIQTGANVEELNSEAASLIKAIRGDQLIEKFHSAWQTLQAYIDHLMNSTEHSNISIKSEGIKQLIEKKTGLIRQHMMGKRVNFAARSVITPDPNLDINEIGIPEEFAKKLTYPVRVTPFNVTELRKLILNGPNVHPGATMIENERGKLLLIPKVKETRQSMAKQLLTPDSNRDNQGTFKGVKIVHRHLLTGDFVLLNRQPTLHKPSIMAHSARILKGEKTLRMHYSNCKSYNADFDGDEMNVHFPQNEIARSEAVNIVNVCNQNLVPKDGTPLSGLIQDHVIAGVRLSIRGKFYTKDDYQLYVFTALAHKTGHIITLPPAIMKPVQLWSGKQILSTLIINCLPPGQPLLNLTGKAKINSNSWIRRPPRPWKCGQEFTNSETMSEAEIIIRQGELLTGVLDKTHCGATQYGLIHSVFDLYGGIYSCRLLSGISKLCSAFLQREGFTLGVKDILVVPKADLNRSDFIGKLRQVGTVAAARAIKVSPKTDEDAIRKKIEESYAANPKFRMIIDREFKTEMDPFTNNINKTCIPGGLVSKFPDNNLQLMVRSGAKGSLVNCMQISCLLGQIELEGKRPPLMISGKSLPSFRPYEITPRAGGFIDGRFLTGIQPQEFFFHCMAGREGLIDTAVKTSRSGYLQRCLVKHLEGLTIKYDLTVRDSDNRVIQFFYGEDGMDIGKAQFLNEKQIDFLIDNMNVIMNDEEKKNLEIDEEVRKYLKKIKHWRKKYGSLQKLRQSYNCRQLKRCPDPAVSKFPPDHYPGVLNERVEKLMDEYLKKTRDESVEDFKNMIKVKSMSSMCSPGEPVGLLAAQSIGEPSTQMTLNTFHFAGRGEMNVTLGIPRLREILMFASKNILTPSMEIPFKPNTSQAAMEKLCKKLNRVTLENVLEKIHVKSHLDTISRQEVITLKFHFLPQNLYQSDYYVKPKHILKHMEKIYFDQMFQAIKKVSMTHTSFVTSKEKAPRTRGPKPESDEEDDGEKSKKDAQAKRTLDDQSSESEPEEEKEESDFKHKREDQEPDSDENEDEEEKNDEIAEVKHEETEAEALSRSKVVNSFRFAQNYKVDTKSQLWCELTFSLPLSIKKFDITGVLKDTAKKSIVWQTPKIKRAIMYQNNAGQTLLRTDGINIREMFKYSDILELKKLYCNDIHAIADTYGIEAAARVLVNEIRDVFNVYGITVDHRHLSLIADYMTSDGIFQSMNRKGMEDGASPLQQMSFESSLIFLKSAIIQGKVDDLQSPSSCLMVGHPYQGGTGGFGLIQEFSKSN